MMILVQLSGDEVRRLSGRPRLPDPWPSTAPNSKARIASFRAESRDAGAVILYHSRIAYRSNWGASMRILRSTDAYEAFLRNELGHEVVEEGLLEKRYEMASGPFPFLRATYWRWAETIQDIEPELTVATRVLAVGDIHLENFGTWRDLDGRLVWGVNDYDEAAEMPYTLDLLRLATSALLTTSEPSGPDAQAIADAILSGYRKGLSEPRPFILDRDLGWLRKAVIVPEKERAGFWTKLDKKRRKFEERPEGQRPKLWPRYEGALLAALPPGSPPPQIWYRSAGVGSLGRPRWVAQSVWCGDWVIREAKGVVPSGWTRVHDGAGRALRCIEISEVAREIRTAR